MIYNINSSNKAIFCLINHFFELINFLKLLQLFLSHKLISVEITLYRQLSITFEIIKFFLFIFYQQINIIKKFEINLCCLHLFISNLMKWLLFNFTNIKILIKKLILINLRFWNRKFLSFYYFNCNSKWITYFSRFIIFCIWILLLYITN